MGPPSGFTLSCLVFSSSLVFSSVCLFFPRHLVCAHRPRRGARCHRPEDSGVDIAAARIVILFFHSHFSLFSRESFVRCARKKNSPFIALFPFLVGGCRQLAHRPFDGHFWMSFIRRPIHHFAITLVLRAHDLLGPLVSHFLARLCVRSADMSWLRRGLHIWKRGQLKRGGEL